MGRYTNWAQAKKAEIDAKDTLISALRDRVQKLRDMLFWAEIDLGATITVGTQARYLLKFYECIKEHTKSIARTPLDKGYWKEVEE